MPAAMPRSLGRCSQAHYPFTFLILPHLLCPLQQARILRPIIFTVVKFVLLAPHFHFELSNDLPSPFSLAKGRVMATIVIPMAAEQGVPTLCPPTHIFSCAHVCPPPSPPPGLRANFNIIFLHCNFILGPAGGPTLRPPELLRRELFMAITPTHSFSETSPARIHMRAISTTTPPNAAEGSSAETEADSWQSAMCIPPHIHSPEQSRSAGNAGQGQHSDNVRSLAAVTPLPSPAPCSREDLSPEEC